MIRATRPKQISELLGKLPGWSRRAAGDGDKRPQTTSKGPIDADLLPLPAALKGKIEAHMEGSTLILIAQTNAAAQILRFHGNRLASAVNAQGTRIVIGAHTNANQIPAKQDQQNRKQIPSSAAPLLTAVAEECDHKALSSALERLAKMATQDPEQKP